jgi:starch synthase (maltosyl-transferring)
MTQDTRSIEQHGSDLAPPRVVIEHVKPGVDWGRFPIKRIVGERVAVTAHIYADGHDSICAVLLHRNSSEAAWQEVPMQLVEWGLDLWQGSFAVTSVGTCFYTLRAWVDPFVSWQKDLQKKVEAGQDVSVDVLVGVKLVEEATKRASDGDAREMQEWAASVRARCKTDAAGSIRLALDQEFSRLVRRYPDKLGATTYAKELEVVVDRERAGFSAWYEMFPRSCTFDPERHGTFKDCEHRLPYIAAMGFDVLYFPPIHPIGRVHRKGRNNNPICNPEGVGSPWGIGAEEGGHKSIHPQLGTLEDFRHLVRAAQKHGIEVALDVAFHCAPDHPWVKEHPEWFRWRPDGTVQYAENPPKKYEDIYPLNFETEKWEELWAELKSIFLFWIDQGVQIFRVDNPHTKPLRFWEWLIREVKRDYPDVIFLAEAFTRPKVMYYLAKLGFTQSYTYFAWRNTKWELTQYFSELVHTEVHDYFRPSLWPNTPDILTEYMQFGGRPAFMARLVLAATLGANYGIYGPAFELCENRPRSPGGEEYLNSEKYEIKAWDISRPDSLKDLIGRVNRIRRENPALQRDRGLRFHSVDNEQLIAYSKATEDMSNLVLTVVNLDPHYTQSGWVEIPLEELGLDPHQPYQIHDLISDVRYIWHGPCNYVELNPHVVPAHIFLLRRRVRTEKDFDYYT